MISERKSLSFMKEYNTEYKDYGNYSAIMISIDRGIFNEKSAVRARMIEYSKLYKELHIIVFSVKRFKIIKISDNCTIYSTNSFTRLHYISNAVKIGRKIIKKMDRDDSLLVSCQDPFETGLAGKCLASLKDNSELLLQIHTDLFSPYFTSSKIGLKNSLLNKIRLLISKFTLPHAQIIRVVSKKIADSLVERGIDAGKIIVKPIEVNVEAMKNGVPAFNLHEKFPQFKKIILMVCRLEAEKNIEMALNAMKIVQVQIPDAGLIIVGSGTEMAYLKKYAFKLKIEASTAFVGWQTDLIPYYKGCDIFLSTSWYEGYGMTFKEAQVAGCKIVSTDVGIAREVGADIADWKPESIALKLIEALK